MVQEQMAAKKVLWFFGPYDHKYTGVWIYSEEYIRALKQHFDITEKIIPFNSKSFLRVLYQFFYLPLLLMFERSKIIVLYEETYLPLLLFPIKKENVVVIIHDLREDWGVSTSSIIKKFFLFLKKGSYTHLNEVRTVVVPSSFTKDCLVNYGISSDNINVIPNPINDSFKKLWRTEKEMHEMRKTLFEKYVIDNALKKRILLYVGSEEKRKNIQTIIEAVSMVDDTVLVKIGREIEKGTRAELTALAKEVNTNVIFIDQVPIVDLVNFYNIADVFIFPSLYEGFGRTPVEAQACGCPVIASKEASLKEVLGTGALFLENPKDAKELAEKIKQMLKDQELRQSLVLSGKNNAERFSINVNGWRGIFLRC